MSNPPKERACDGADSCADWAAHTWRLPSGKEVKLCRAHRRALENLGVDIVKVRTLSKDYPN